ncbi:MAG: DNA-directed RNA polymerase subunit D [Candidatus Micrarchaeia archaeon]
MKLEALESKEDNVFSFKLKDSNLKFANYLRRSIISKVPVVAIDSVIFYENSSSIFDEYLAHRVGLIPIKTPDNLKEEEEYVFVLDVKGPKKVYSADLKPVKHDLSVAIENIPIIALADEQPLRFEAKAKLGVGKDHAKYQAGSATYIVDEKNGDITFRVESFYQIEVKELVLRALDILEKEVSALEKEISKIK